MQAYLALQYGGEGYRRTASGTWLGIQRTQEYAMMSTKALAAPKWVRSSEGSPNRTGGSPRVWSGYTPSPATHAILAQLKAGETVHQAGELPKTLRVFKMHNEPLKAV